MASKPARYKLASSFGMLPKGAVVYASLYHQATADDRQAVVLNECGKGPAHQVPVGLLTEWPYDEMDD